MIVKKKNTLEDFQKIPWKMASVFQELCTIPVTSSLEIITLSEQQNYELTLRGMCMFVKTISCDSQAMCQGAHATAHAGVCGEGADPAGLQSPASALATQSMEVVRSPQLVDFQLSLAFCLSLPIHLSFSFCIND